MMSMTSIDVSDLNTSHQNNLSAFELIDNIDIVNDVLVPKRKRNSNEDVNKYINYEYEARYDIEGNLVDNRINSSINNNNMIALLLRAIKELKEEIEELKTT